MKEQIIIIGAGISGLILAQKLSNCFDVVVYEKSAGYGGRCATRYAKNYKFDHGAPCFQTNCKKFKTFLETLEQYDIISSWNGEFIEFVNDRITSRRRWGDTNKHYYSKTGMNLIGTWLARDLNVILNTKIKTLKRDKDKWILYDSDNNAIDSANWVITTIPSDQAYNLLPEFINYRNNLNLRKMLPCFSLMLGLNNLPDVSWDYALVKQRNLSCVTINSNKLSDQTLPSIVALSTNLWAKQNIDLNKDAVIDHMLRELNYLLPITSDNIEHIDLQRWLYANIKYDKNHIKSYIDVKNNIASCGDWCIKGTVSSAFVSADNLAYQILHLLKS